ncbi:putative oxidoreductase [Histoplasma capsulatum]|uniref:Putative oxidoreductase n=1 Tax=Ajellomyces capsulatus TaxID=5037 RepID=A0A8A1MIF4_AJECA|nr:putative oxidoreductase [Histoplasma capsulatum]
MSLLTLTGKYGAGTNPFSSEHSPMDECRASLVLGLSGCLTGLSILVVVLRCYCRGQIERHYWYDDYVIFFATICSIIVLACFIGESHSGLGCYILFLSSEDREYLAKIGYIHEIFGLLGIHAVKISVGFFILRTISQVNIRNSAKAMIAVNAAVDLILSTLPLPLYYTSNSSKYSRVALIGIVALAYIACSAAITKIVRLANLLAISDSWRIELQIGVLATSLPTINPILTVILASIYKTFRTPKWPTSSPDTHDHISPNRPIRMGSHSLRRQSRSTLDDYRASSITTQHSGPEQQHITRYPSSHYKVEVSASRKPSSQNDMRRDAILAAGRSGFPAIVRTTDVYIHTASGNKGEYEEDVENTSAEIPPAN